MALKRKRSTDFTDSSPASTNSTSSYLRSSSQSPSPVRFPAFSSRNTSSQWPHPQDRQVSSYKACFAGDVNGRTRKRWRDLRPDAETIHVQTLQKLYDAQHIYPHASPVESSITAICQAGFQQPVQKTSLHSFWKIQSARPPVASVSIGDATRVVSTSNRAHHAQRCEDCDAPLDYRDEDQDAMDLDFGETELLAGRACTDCGKRVCDLCAISKENRICLECATEGGVHK